MEEIAKPLKLVHDDQIRLQGIDTRMGKLSAQTSDQRVSPLVKLVRIGLSAPGKEVAYRLQFLEQIRVCFYITAEAFDNPRVNTLERQVAHGAVPSRDAGAHLKQIVQTTRPGNAVLQHPQQ